MNIMCDYDLGSLYRAHTQTLTDPSEMEYATQQYTKYQTKLTKRIHRLESYYCMPIYEDEDEMEMEFLSQTHILISTYYHRLQRKLSKRIPL